MMRPSSRAVRRALAVGIALGLALTACSSDDTAPGDGYVFDSADADVRVDTPQLRALKAKTGIEDCPQTNAGSEPTTDGLPDAVLPCLGGGRDVDLAGLAAKPTVVNFWAQSCGPCRTESPLFQQLHEQAGDRIEVLGIDFQDAQPVLALEFAQQLGLTYPQAADPDAALKGELRISGLPATVFVDADGSVADVHFGAIDSLAEMRTLVEDNLAVTW